MDILHSEGVITFKGHRIPLQTIGRPKHPVQVWTTNAVWLHGMTEGIIDGYIDGPEEDMVVEESMLMETDMGFQERYGGILAPVIVNVVGKTTTQVRVLNPFDADVWVPADVLIRTLQQALVRNIILNEESPFDRHNYQAVRRITLERELPQHDPQNVKSMNIEENFAVLPHLQALFEQAGAKHSKARKESHQSATKQLPRCFLQG